MGRACRLCVVDGARVALGVCEQFTHGTDAGENRSRLQREIDLRCLAIGDALESLEVTDRDEVRGRVAFVDGAEHPLDRPTFTFGDGFPLVSLGIGNCLDGFTLTLGVENPRLLDAFGLENR